MNWKSVWLGAMVSFSLMVIGWLGGAWWTLTVWAPEMDLSGYLQLMFWLPVGAGGIAAGYGAPRLPWRHGGTAGAVTGLLLLGLQWLLVPTLMSLPAVLKLLGTAVVLGSLAGVVGQNLRRAAERRARGSKPAGVQKF